MEDMTNYILKLQKENDESILAHKLAEARYKTKQETINTCTTIIAEQMRLNLLAAFTVVLRDT